MLSRLKAQLLTKKSNRIIDVFNKTVTKLQAVNDKISKATAENAKEIEVLKAQQAILKAQQDRNNRIANKITEFLG